MWLFVRARMACLCVVCKVSCARTCVRKWHMLAVGGSAPKAGWFAGGEPESQHSKTQKNPCPLCVEDTGVNHRFCKELLLLYTDSGHSCRCCF